MRSDARNILQNEERASAETRKAALRVLIMAALPEELRPFMRKTGSWRRGSSTAGTVYTRQSSDMEFVLAETGMGVGGLWSALNDALRRGPVDCIVSTGFAGSIVDGHAVGRTLLCDRFTLWRPEVAEGESGSTTKYAVAPSPELLALCASKEIDGAHVLTTSGCHPKAFLRERFGGSPSLVDMESAFVAAMAAELGIPFLCLRSVSDALGDEIDFDPTAISDSGGRISIAKVLLAVMGRPALAVSFYKAWRRSSKAGDALAEALSAILGLPSGELRRALQGSVPSAKG